MVIPHDLQHQRMLTAERLEDFLAFRHVLLDLLELRRAERTGLVQHRVAGADLPDVVQLAAQADLVEDVAGEAEHHRGPDRVAAHPLGMASGVDVLFFQHPDRHLDLAHELLLVAGIELADGRFQPFLIAVLEVAVFENEAALFEGVVDPGADFIDEDRLCEVVERALLQAFHGGRDFGDAGEHDHGDIGPAAVQLAEERDAVHLGHVDVAHDERHLPVLFHQRERFAAVAGFQRRHALRLQNSCEGVAHLRIVVDNDRAVGRDRGIGAS